MSKNKIVKTKREKKWLVNSEDPTNNYKYWFYDSLLEAQETNGEVEIIEVEVISRTIYKCITTYKKK